jgi:hypothetical protein
MELFKPACVLWTRMTNRYTFLFVIVLLFSACTEEPPARSNGNPDEEVWLVPKGLVRDSGVGFDGIVALQDPKLIEASSVDFLDPDELVIGIYTGNEYRVYPHQLLDWHEIINDRDGGFQYAINYCPLTGSGLAWNLFVDGKHTTFGVSGFLINSNLVPYDRRTESLWSQMLVKCFNGESVGEVPAHHAIIETTWSSWLAMYPDSKVVSLETGFTRAYGQYPYVDPVTGLDYRTADFIIQSIEFDDRRLHAKERLLGIVVNDDAKAYRFDSFQEDISIVEDTFMGEDFVIVGSKGMNFMLAFERQLEDGTELSFEPIAGALPNILEDNEGNTWDIFGYATSGPRKGERLVIPKSYIAYWFAFGTFFQGLDIYGQ